MFEVNTFGRFDTLADQLLDIYDDMLVYFVQRATSFECFTEKLVYRV